MSLGTDFDDGPAGGARGLPEPARAIQTPLAGETPDDKARLLVRYVNQIQAHNWIGFAETIRSALIFLDPGDIDFRRYLRTRRADGLDGWITVEHADQHPWEATPRPRDCRSAKAARRRLSSPYVNPIPVGESRAACSILPAHSLPP